jgi:hypothetical protein
MQPDVNQNNINDVLDEINQVMGWFHVIPVLAMTD